MKKISSVLFLSLLVFFLNYSLFISVCFPKPNSDVWEYLYKDDYDNLWYYNKTNIIKTSNTMLVWFYKEISDSQKTIDVKRIKEGDLAKSKRYQKYDHSIILIEIDCKKNMLKMNKYVDYDVEDNILDSYDFKYNLWANSVGKHFYNLCE